jgi:2-dehydropantoate 2-reductase
MRFIIYGAGAVGGVIGARLFQSGYDVLLIARGAHGEAIRARGLTLLSPEEEVTLSIAVAAQPSEVDFDASDVVLFCMKTNDSLEAMDALRAAGGGDSAVVCVQNGVENERLAARRFERVYAVPVRLPSTHMEPGVVQADGSPRSGVLDIGCYPQGTDAVCDQVAAALSDSNFSSFAEPRVMRHKYQKLLMNLGNAIDAACGPGQRPAGLHEAAREEAIACYRAAGIDFASDEEDLERRGEHYRVREVAGRIRAGGSTFQSLARGKRAVEADYLNGEIVLLGRLHGVPTPVNATLQRVANELARDGMGPGRYKPEELLEVVRPVSSVR